MSEVDEMTRATTTTARGSEKEANLETLPEADLVLALQLLSAARQLRRTSVRELRDTDLPRIMGLAGIELIEPAALEQARRWTALRAALLATEAYDYSTLSELRKATRPSATRTWVTRHRQRMQMFTVPDGVRAIIPAFQLDNAGEPRWDLAPLLAVLLPAGVDGWELWTWLTSPTSLLSGDIPEVVAAANVDRALTAAQRFAARR
jgi:hypothetical protein